MIVIYHFEAKNSKKIFGPNATSGDCTSFILDAKYVFIQEDFFQNIFSSSVATSN